MNGFLTMGLWQRLFANDDGSAAVRPLYDAIVVQARLPAWYQDGGVADTMDGRFDMVSAVFAIVMIRLESLSDDEAKPVVTLLTETFVRDMDGQLREIGFGDVGLGKHVGKMVSALGGRLGVYRDAFAGRGDLAQALTRNLYRDDVPSQEALAFTAAKLTALHEQIGERSLADLMAAKL
jgi:cytochrome b pre-mRNA-processing protein 3